MIPCDNARPKVPPGSNARCAESDDTSAQYRTPDFPELEAVSGRVLGGYMVQSPDAQDCIEQLVERAGPYSLSIRTVRSGSQDCQRTLRRCRPRCFSIEANTYRPVDGS